MSLHATVIQQSPCPPTHQQRCAPRPCLSLGLTATPSVQVSLLTGIIFMLGAVCRLGSMTKLLTPPIISRWALTCQLHKEWASARQFRLLGWQSAAGQGVGFGQALLQLPLSPPP